MRSAHLGFTSHDASPGDHFVRNFFMTTPSAYDFTARQIDGTDIAALSQFRGQVLLIAQRLRFHPAVRWAGGFAQGF
jgi:hypothetical protein